jgi:hypothetical protein
MAIDISNLLNKIENEGTTPSGKLPAKEWNQLVEAVRENQNAVTGAIKGINYNGTEYKNVVNGILQMAVADTSGRSTKFEWIQEAPNVIARGSSCIVEFNIVDRIKDDNDASVLIPYDQPGTVNFYVDDKLVGTVNRVYDKDYVNSSGPIKFDFSKVASLSTINDNQIKIEYINTGVTINKYFTVTVVDAKITVENFNTVYTTNNPTSINVSATFNQETTKCFVYVSVDDYVIVDNREISKDIRYEIKSEFEPYNTHGIHNVKIWGELHVGESVILTDPMSYNYIFGNTSVNTPIVMSTVNEGSEYELYGKLQVDYIAYLSGANTGKNITIKLSNDEKTLLSTSQLVEFNNGVGQNSYTFTLFPTSGVSENDFIGNNRKLIISMGETDEFSHTILVNIKESTIVLTQANGYTVYLSSNGRSNNEPEDVKRKWISKSMDSTHPDDVDVTFDNSIEFNDNGSGWIADSDGNMAMHLKKGKYFTLNYAPFSSNPTYSDKVYGNKNGLTISIEFATRNCLNINSTVISCLEKIDGKDRGFYITASDAKLIGSDIELGAKFKEDTRIKFDIVIEGAQRPYTYDTVIGKEGKVEQGTDNESLAMMFIDGVYTGITLITEDTNFNQSTYVNDTIVPGKYIKFGSEDCDLDVYNIRIYNRALSIEDIVNNYSYDTPKFEDKIAIASRNKIFYFDANGNPNLPAIEIGNLRTSRPELPFFYVDMRADNNDVLPQDKDNWKRLDTTVWDNPIANSGDNKEALTSFEVTTAVLKNQGTSSMTYPWPWRNWDWKTGDTEFDSDKNLFKFYFPDKANEKSNSKSWYQYDYTGGGDNLAIKKITLKKDYASSEMCNNAICSELFTDMAIGLGSGKYNAMSPTMKADFELNKKTDYRLSLKAKPCFMFQILENKNTPGTAGNGINALGMMNLIPNKNEVGYLGFKQNKWENKDEGATEREQAWELCENRDADFWINKLPYFTRNTDGTFVNPIKDLYEARTPKDSSIFKDADFGFTPKGTATVSQEQANNLIDETRDIIDFHNWLVDTNQFLATDNELTNEQKQQAWNNNNGSLLYTHDTKEYRRAKFENEANDRLILDQWILYYIWREQFWMFDSGFKNLQIYTVGSNPETKSSILQWGCMVRDADTALGIQNTGKDYFPPHIEDIDYYTFEDDGIKFHYGEAKDIYDITQLKIKKGEKAETVLNGQFGSIWVNLRDVFGSRITEMYQSLINNVATTNFGADATIKKFRNHQEKWCESLYNFGMRQYFGGSPFSNFNESALGDKKNSRAQWLSRGFYYRMGKYRCLSDTTSFRINRYETPDGEFDTLNVKAYIPMYIGCGGTSASMNDSKNVIRLVDGVYEDGSIGKPISVGEDGFDFPKTGDAVSYIFGTDNITDIGDLARVCKINEVQSSDLRFPKLRELNLGHEKTRTTVCGVPCEPGVYNEYYSDANGQKIREFVNDRLIKLPLNNLTQLITLDVTNHTKLSDIAMTNCKQLQHLYAHGTALKSIALPATTSLKTIYLGKELTSLSLVNLSGIEDLSIEGLDNCENLQIVNCGSYMAKESYNVMKMAINKLESYYKANRNRNVVLKGIDWEITSSNGYKEIERLVDIDADLAGKIKIKSLPNTVKIKLINKYGNIDDSKNALYIEYIQQPITSINLPSKLYIFEEGDYDLTQKLIIKPNEANTYAGSKWKITANANTYATLDENGILHRNNVECEQDVPSSTITVVVSQMNDTAGNKREDVTQTTEIYFYERIAKPGDIVFNDGSFADETDSSKTPIGVCFYVDPNDKHKRLMCGLQLLVVGNTNNVGSWGVGNGFTNANGDVYYGTSQNLKLSGDPSYNCYDIKKIYNITDSGTQYNYNTTGGTDPSDSNTGLDNLPISKLFSDTIYRDENNETNDYFKKFELNTYFGDLGWKPAENSVDTGDVKITINEEVPSGYYKTLAIIEHRNKLLTEYQNTQNQEGAFSKPVGNNYYSEISNLKQLLTNAEGWNYEERNVLIDNTGGSTLYYPAASLCYAYEPVGVVNLNNKFKKHNWFLPASGDLLRLLYYMYQTYSTYNGNKQLHEKPVYSEYTNANAFYSAVKNNVIDLSNFNNNNVSNAFWSSTEYGRNYAIAGCYNGKYSIMDKHQGGPTGYEQINVIPICAF